MALQLVDKDELIKSLDSLPPESLVEVRQFVDYLRYRSEQPSRRIVRLGGLWKDWPPITDEDLAQSRREMWGRFGERDL